MTTDTEALVQGVETPVGVIQPTSAMLAQLDVLP
jgi:hypothetical protein